ncbi:unnamed protein product [Mytilus coruscus]|uniref:Reverse transcriptase RNase H-like domain-containing protein n=1 Tax=Mytilus coruscus TaxID=42192 RepID=A0A6J8BEI9_MYTCO|nr:unnamed protein product [Mytilus coruscus]
MAPKGIIEPSSSAWCSPVVMVTKKKDQSIRFYIDFRKINDITEKDCQPIPLIEDTLDALSGSKWFSTLDMRNCYWQCGLEEKDREKTAFTIPGSGLWQFKVLCFGLCGAPATFERKTFSKSERNYCVTGKELLAIDSAAKNFHQYLYGRSFTVRTDHGSLRWLVNFKNPEGQLARWLETLGAYDFQIIHRPSRIHSNADALSRRPCPDDCSYCSKVEDKFSNVGLGEVVINNEISTKEVVVKSVVVDDTSTLTGAVKVEMKGKSRFARETSVDVCKSKTNENIINRRIGVIKTRSMKSHQLDQQKPSSSSPMHDEQFAEIDFDLENEQKNDPVLKIIRDWLVNNLKPIWSEISKFSPIIKYFWNRIESFEIKDDILCRKWIVKEGIMSPGKK